MVTKIVSIAWLSKVEGALRFRSYRRQAAQQVISVGIDRRHGKDGARFRTQTKAKRIAKNTHIFCDMTWGGCQPNGHCVVP